jgi:hypothetical protein
MPRLHRALHALLPAVLVLAALACADVGFDATDGPGLRLTDADFFEGVTLSYADVGAFPDGLEVARANGWRIARVPGDGARLFLQDYEEGPVMEVRLDGLTEAHGEVALFPVDDVEDFGAQRLAVIAGPWAYFVDLAGPDGEVQVSEAPLEPAPSTLDDGEALARTVILRSLKTCPSGTPGCLLFGDPRDVLDAIDPREPVGGWDLVAVEAPDASGVRFVGDEAQEGVDPALRFTRARIGGEVWEDDEALAAIDRGEHEPDHGIQLRRVELLHGGRAIHAFDIAYEVDWEVAPAIDSGVERIGDTLLVWVWDHEEILLGMSLHDAATGERLGAPEVVNAEMYYEPDCGYGLWSTRPTPVFVDGGRTVRFAIHFYEGSGALFFDRLGESGRFVSVPELDAAFEAGEPAETPPYFVMDERGALR